MSKKKLGEANMTISLDSKSEDGGVALLITVANESHIPLNIAYNEHRVRLKGEETLTMHVPIKLKFQV